MKKIILFIVSLTITISTFAQRDVTKFLGIPVDGFKPQMIQKLKEKGFVSSSSDKDILVGEFNGTDVKVHIVTNNNKVCRIMLCDAHNTNKTDIRIRFNKLCQQFSNNAKYTTPGDYTIPEGEDITYEMRAKNKRYEAVFYQKPILTDSLAIAKDMKNKLLEKYSQKELENPTDEIAKEITKLSVSYVMDLMVKKPVWFMISDYYGKYFITMYYDNEYNKANGEDL